MPIPIHAPCRETGALSVPALYALSIIGTKACLRYMESSSEPFQTKALLYQSPLSPSWLPTIVVGATESAARIGPEGALGSVLSGRRVSPMISISAPSAAADLAK